MKKTPAGGPAGVLVREQSGARSWEPKTRPVMHDFDPDAILKLYKFARSETMVDKSNNSPRRGFRDHRAADGADVGKGRVPTTLGCPGDDTAKRPVSLRTGIITNEGIESTT